MIFKFGCVKFGVISTGGMYIEELKEEGELEIGAGKELVTGDVQRREIVVSNAKRVFILLGARALFYPTLLYNVVRNKVQSEFRWWDGVDEVIFSFLWFLQFSFPVI